MEADYGLISGGYPADYYSSQSYDVAEFDVTAAVSGLEDGTLDNNGWYLRAHVAYSFQYYYTSDYAVGVDRHTGKSDRPDSTSQADRGIYPRTGDHGPAAAGYADADQTP